MTARRTGDKERARTEEIPPPKRRDLLLRPGSTLLLNTDQQAPWTYLFREGQWVLYPSGDQQDILLKDALQNTLTDS